MPHTLKNNNLQVSIDLPEENYQFSRFDWTGKITKVSYKGKVITGNELIDPSKDVNKGSGLYNEFGIDKPIGFDTIEHKDWFHKIGIGLLQKNTSSYLFHHPYHIQSANFENENTDRSIKITCISPLFNGYAYCLEKDILLLEDGFIIHYHLENRGHKAIITSEYNHNFLAINNDPIGINYKLKFNFNLNKTAFNEVVNPNEVAVINSKSITFKDVPKSDIFFSNINAGKNVAAKWYLENKTQGVGISETGNFKTSKINIWGCGHVISPELFIDINLQPKQSMKWSRHYSVYDV